MKKMTMTTFENGQYHFRQNLLICWRTRGIWHSVWCMRLCWGQCWGTPGFGILGICTCRFSGRSGGHEWHRNWRWRCLWTARCWQREGHIKALLHFSTCATWGRLDSNVWRVCRRFSSSALRVAFFGYVWDIFFSLWVGINSRLSRVQMNCYSNFGKYQTVRIYREHVKLFG